MHITRLVTSNINYKVGITVYNSTFLDWPLLEVLVVSKKLSTWQLVLLQPWQQPSCEIKLGDLVLTKVSCKVLALRKETNGVDENNFLYSSSAGKITCPSLRIS